MKFYVELGVSVVETVNDGQFVGNCTSSISQSGMVAIEINDNRFPLLHFSEVFQADGITPIGADLVTAQDYLIANTVFKTASGGSGAIWGSLTGTLSDQTDLQGALDAKQDDLVSGTNIKTINGNSVLGSGDLVISGGGGGGAHVLTQPIPARNYSATVLSIPGYSTNTTQANALTLIPFIPAHSLTIDSMSFQIVVATTGSNIRLLIYSDNAGKPDLKMFESGDISGEVNGLKTYNVNYTFEAGTTYWIGTHTSASLTYVCHVPGQLLPLNQANFYAGNLSVYTIAYPFGSAPTNITGNNFSMQLPYSISLKSV